MGNCYGRFTRWRRRRQLRGIHFEDDLADSQWVTLEVSDAYHSSIAVDLDDVLWLANSQRVTLEDCESDAHDLQDYNLGVESRSEYVSSKVWAPSTPYCCASFDVTNKATTIEWDGYGLKIHVLDDSIPYYLTLVRLDVSVHVFENRESLPLSVGDHADPVSALYSIKVGTGKLCKPVTIEIQHCSSQHIIKEAMILRAGSDREHFTPIGDAVFDHKYGKVTVPTEFSEGQEYNDFSWFIIALRRVFFPYTIHYKAQVYISKENLKMHFIVTMAIDPCTTVCW